MTQESRVQDAKNSSEQLQQKIEQLYQQRARFQIEIEPLGKHIEKLKLQLKKQELLQLEDQIFDQKFKPPRMLEEEQKARLSLSPTSLEGRAQGFSLRYTDLLSEYKKDFQDLEQGKTPKQSAEICKHYEKLLSEVTTFKKLAEKTKVERFIRDVSILEGNIDLILCKIRWQKHQDRLQEQTGELQKLEAQLKGTSVGVKEVLDGKRTAAKDSGSPIYATASSGSAMSTSVSPPIASLPPGSDDPRSPSKR